MKHLIVIGALSAALLGAGSVLLADEQWDLGNEIKALNEIAKTPDGQIRVLDRIAAATGVPSATLAQERTTTKLGFGELMTAHLLATASGKTFDQIVGQFSSGKGWGKIANENGVKLGGVLSTAHESSKAAQHEKGGEHGGGSDKGGGKGGGGKGGGGKGGGKGK